MNIQIHIHEAERSLKLADSTQLSQPERGLSALTAIAESLLGIAKILNEVEGNGTIRVRDEGGQV